MASGLSNAGKKFWVTFRLSFENMIANKSFRLRKGVKRCLSVISGPSFTPKEWTIDQLLMRAVEKMPDCKQAVFDLFATEFTFQETHEIAEKFAAGLLAAGLKPGDKVAVWGPNQPEWYIMKWATAKVGMPLGKVLK